MMCRLLIGLVAAAQALGLPDGGALPVGMNDQIVRAARAQPLLHALLWNAPS